MIQNDLVKQKKIPPPVPPKADKAFVSLNHDNSSKKEQIKATKSEDTGYVKNQTNANPVVKPRFRDTKKKRLTDAEAREQLLEIASPGDPNEKYTLKDKLGSGYVVISFVELIIISQI